MNVLKSHATTFGVMQRVFDVAILLLVTWVIMERYGQVELMKVLGIYGSILLLLVFSLFDIYKSWRMIAFRNVVKSLFLAWASVLILFNAIVLLVLFLLKMELFDLLWPFGFFRIQEATIWSVSVFLCLLGLRAGVRLFMIAIRRRGYNQRHAVVVGVGRAGKDVAAYLAENRWIGIKVAGFFDDLLSKGEEVFVSAKPLSRVLGAVQECSEYCLRNKVDVIFIALPMSAEDKIGSLIWTLGTRGVSVFLIPDILTMGIQRAKIQQLGELDLMGFNLFPAWKRMFDIVFSMAAIVLTFPVWLVIIILIKLEDGGPVFYRHRRIMECGKQFGCFKFRTMHVDADKRLHELLDSDPGLLEEWKRSYKLKNDPRITMVGRFLRKASLDELPQFINVLLGDMSVVGARPIVAEELEKYYGETALTYCAMKPGLTGLWQSGKRNDVADYEERVRLDQWYVLNVSLWLDIKIIFKTIWRVLAPKGAY